MSELGFELLFRFIWGAAVILTFVSRTETTERFPRIGAWILTALAACAAWLALSSPLARSQTLPGLGMLVAGSMLYAYGRARGVRSLGFFLYLWAPLPFLRGQPLGETLNFASAGLLFGAIFVGQYLGHWFLTVPGLHINELKRMVHFLFAALVLRTLEVAYTLFVTVGAHPHVRVDDMGRPLGLDISLSANLSQMSSTQSLFDASANSWFGLGFFGLLILTTRLLWGIFAPYLLAAMIRSTVNTRSTQSATGIFYALSVMILLGEGTALYLKNTLGWFV